MSERLWQYQIQRNCINKEEQRSEGETKQLRCDGMFYTLQDTVDTYFNFNTAAAASVTQVDWTHIRPMSLNVRPLSHVNTSFHTKLKLENYQKKKKKSLNFLLQSIHTLSIPISLISLFREWITLCLNVIIIKLPPNLSSKTAYTQLWGSFLKAVHALWLHEAWIIRKPFSCLGLFLTVRSWPHGPERLNQTDAKKEGGEKKAIETMTYRVFSSDRKLLQAVSGLWSLGPQCLSVNKSRKWGQELCLTHWEPIKTQTRSYTHLYTCTHTQGCVKRRY